jgi:hypothetical protein
MQKLMTPVVKLSICVYDTGKIGRDMNDIFNLLASTVHALERRFIIYDENV